MKELVFEYLNDNCEQNKDFLMKSICDRFKLQKENALNLYYWWKSKFMKSVKCVPGEINMKIKSKFTIENNIIIGLYETYIVCDNCIKVGYHFFNSIDEIEKYRYFRKENNLRSMDSILDEAIEVIEMKIMV